MRHAIVRATAVGILGLLVAAAAAEEEAPLDVRGPWQGQVALDRGAVGVWTLGVFPIFDSVGTDEVIALDDEGRLHVLIPYSGRWTDLPVLEERSWLGGLAHGDLDAAVEGAELYTGGERGNLWQVVAHPHGALETRLVAHLPGREIHTLVLDDLDPTRPGREMLVFTWPGGLWLVADGEEGLVVTPLGDLPDRIRDAVVLPPSEGESPAVATVSRAGRLALLRLEEGRPRWETIHEVQSGMGRVARAPGDPAVLYTVTDDGRVLRHAREGDAWATAMIYAGPPGGRGVVAGRFSADPSAETVAIFGYSGEVELLTRQAEGPWSVETVFVDRDKGHWLAKAELDGRNATDELLACGYGGRVVLLSRPPGYGHPGVAARREPPETTETSEPDAAPAAQDASPPTEDDA